MCAENFVSVLLLMSNSISHRMAFVSWDSSDKPIKMESVNYSYTFTGFGGWSLFMWLLVRPCYGVFSKWSVLVPLDGHCTYWGAWKWWRGTQHYELSPLARRHWRRTPDLSPMRRGKPMCSKEFHKWPVFQGNIPKVLRSGFISLKGLRVTCQSFNEKG